MSGGSFQALLDHLFLSSDGERAVRRRCEQIHDELRSIGPEAAMEEYETIDNLQDYREHLQGCRSIAENGLPAETPPRKGYRIVEGEVVVLDLRTGNELERYPVPEGPEGEPMELFQPYPVRLLTTIGPYEKGYETVAEVVPDGSIYINSPEGVLCADAREGEEFEFIKADGEKHPEPNQHPEWQVGVVDQNQGEKRVEGQERRSYPLVGGALFVAGISLVAYGLFSNQKL